MLGHENGSGVVYSPDGEIIETLEGEPPVAQTYGWASCRGLPSGGGGARSVMGHTRRYPPANGTPPDDGSVMSSGWADGRGRESVGAYYNLVVRHLRDRGEHEEGPVVTGISQHRRALLGVITGVACVVALLAGCSSSSSEAITSTSAGSLTPSSSSLTSAAPSGSPPSESQLAEIVLQPSDLPPDWTPTPYEAVPGEATADAAFLRCLGVLSTASDKVAEAHSDDFTLGDARVSSSANSYRSQSAVDANVAAVHSSKASPCIEQELKRELAASGLPAGTAIESVSVKITPGSGGPASPPNVVATGIGTIKISESGQHGVVYLRVAYITGPLIWAEVDSANPGAPLPAPMWESLVWAVADRADPDMSAPEDSGIPIPS